MTISFSLPSLLIFFFIHDATRFTEVLKLFLSLVSVDKFCIDILHPESPLEYELE